MIKRRRPGVIPLSRVDRRRYATCDVFVYIDGTTDSATRVRDDAPGAWSGPGPEMPQSFQRDTRVHRGPFALEWAMRAIFDEGWLIIEEPPGPDNHPDLPARQYPGRGKGVWGFHVAIPIKEVER